MHTIAFFPEMTPLDIMHKPLLDACFADLQPRTSELTFTNLYIWRHAFGIHLTRLDDVLCILALRADPEDSFLLAVLGDNADTEHIKECLSWMSAEGHAPRMLRIDRHIMDRLGLSTETFDCIKDRDNWDYVYRVDDLINLPGEVYNDKKRHIEKFAKRYRFEFRRITPELVPGCKFLQDLWCDEKHCDLYASLRAEHRAISEVLDNMETLGVTGGAILVNERVQAFSLAEPLNADTVVIHIEKASPDLHGAFQVINQQFLEHEWSNWEYVNREQDVGDPGLRRAKESYLPTMMIEKFIVRAK